MIGYWQCFATNEAGTVHNEVRVLPYGKYIVTCVCNYYNNIVSIGWSTLPRALVLNAFKVEQKDDKEALASYSISWQPPSYLGGLNLTDIQYNVIIQRIGANITNNTYYIIPLTVRVTPSLLKTLRIEVRIVFTQVNSEYLPGNMFTKATYDKTDLVETAIG